MHSPFSGSGTSPPARRRHFLHGLMPAASASFGVRTVATHCAYLINLASGKEEVRSRSLFALEDEASRAALLGVPYIVLHPGSSGEDPEEEGVARVAAALRSFGRFPAGVTLLLENTAGQGATLGRSMEQLRRMRSIVSTAFANGCRPR